MSLSRSRGFTLIELMIVVAIIAVVASVAVPNLLSSRMAANEATAISTLRNLATAQEQFRMSLSIDADGDGAGEFGTFAEMSGAVALNLRPGGLGSATPLDPPILGSPFENIDAAGRARKSGYYYLVYLPDVAIGGIAEAPGGGPQGALDPDQCENFWSCYAYPIETNGTGARTFFVDHRGEILQTRMDGLPYGSGSAPPAAHAALSGVPMNSPVGTLAPATDLNSWAPAH